MKAFVIERYQGEISAQEVSAPEPGLGEALVSAISAEVTRFKVVIDVSSNVGTYQTSS